MLFVEKFILHTGLLRCCYDDSVAKIIMDGNNSNIINVEDIRLWYLVGTKAIDISNTKIIDYNGNEVTH